MVHGMGPQAPQQYLPKPSDAGQGGEVLRQVEDDLNYYQQILNGFQQNKDLNPGAFSFADVAEVAKYDEQEEKWRTATAQEKAIYEHAKSRSAQLIQMIRPTGGAVPQAGTASNDPMGIR
jgi:hypothetical protein